MTEHRIYMLPETVGSRETILAMLNIHAALPDVHRRSIGRTVECTNCLVIPVSLDKC